MIFSLRGHLANTPRKVLLVDDNADAVAVIAAWLKRAGHEVHEARDGVTAAELARRVRPDIVFLDLGLPGLDGLAVARQLRSDPESEPHAHSGDDRVRP